MTQTDYGRPPAEAFHTVTDPEQARLLSDPKTFEFFEPFVAREQSAGAAAVAVGCALDTILYRIKTFLRAGLLHVVRSEKRSGRPIKHYRSVHDAYFVPFEVTPFAELEERLAAGFRERQALVVPRLARVLEQSGRNGRRVYRRLDNGDVWQESAGGVQTSFDLYDAESYRKHMETHQGPIAEATDDVLELTDAEARDPLVELYGVWRRFAKKEKADSSKPYFFSSSSPRRYRDALGTFSPASRH